MGIFLATAVVFVLACILLGLGMVIDGRRLQGGCGHKPPGADRCADCPGRNSRQGACER